MLYTICPCIYVEEVFRGEQVSGMKRYSCEMWQLSFSRDKGDLIGSNLNAVKAEEGRLHPPHACQSRVQHKPGVASQTHLLKHRKKKG